MQKLFAILSTEKLISFSKICKVVNVNALIMTLYYPNLSRVTQRLYQDELTKNQEKILIKEKIPFVLVESAYFNKNDYFFRIQSILISSGIPIVFWATDDSKHIHQNLRMGGKCSYILLSDLSYLEDYRKAALVKQNYGFGRLGIDQTIYNPINKDYEKDLGVHDGSNFIPNTASEKSQYINFAAQILSPASFFGIDIKVPQRLAEIIPKELHYNLSNPETCKSGFDNEKYIYNYIFTPTIKKNDRLNCDVQKILARGQVAIGNPASGLDFIFGECYFPSELKRETSAIIELMQNEEQIKRYRLNGLLKVTEMFNIRHTLHDIFRLVDENYPEYEQEKTIALVGLAQNKEEVSLLINSFTRQEYRAKTLFVVIYDKNLAVEGKYENIFFVTDPDTFICNHRDEFDLFCAMDPRDYYGPNYVRELACGFYLGNYGGAGKKKIFELIGKKVVSNGQKEYTVSDEIFSTRGIVDLKTIQNYELLELLHGTSITRHLQPFVILSDQNYIKNGRDFSDAENNTQFFKKNFWSGHNIPEYAALYLSGESPLSTTYMENHVNEKSKILLITNNYPSNQKLYANAFLHRRLLKYHELGIEPQVFIPVSNDQKKRNYVFEGINVIQNTYKALKDEYLCSPKYQKILGHFLDNQVMDILDDTTIQKKVIIWYHGADIHGSNRRWFVFDNERDMAKWIGKSVYRMNRIERILNQPDKYQCVFVSKTLMEEACHDFGKEISEINAKVIHNYIDTNLFNYRQKSSEHRKRILSIRPFSSKVYAQDIIVKAIHLLSKKKFFADLEFSFIGSGRLFYSSLRSIMMYPNVSVQRRFIKQSDIPEIHSHFGVFLSPSRTDSQGVSRDEARASGLVPIATNISAVPEFVNNETGILVPPDDPNAIADAIELLYFNPDKFLTMSKRTAEEIQRQCGFSETITREIELIQVD